MESVNWKKDFEEKDVLDSFDIFIMYGVHKKKYYSLSGIINEFIDYMYNDIKNAYPNKEMQKEIKKHIRGICFSNKNILFEKYGE